MSRDLETTAFVTFYDLKKLDVWKDREQLADDGKAFSILHQHSWTSLRRHIKVYNEWLSPPNSDGHKQHGAKVRKWSVSLDVFDLVLSLLRIHQLS